MDTERQKTADWRIVWQMFFPCVISDLIGGCVEVLGHLDGNPARIVSSLLTFAAIYPFYWRRRKKREKDRNAADENARGCKRLFFPQTERTDEEKGGYFRQNVLDVWKILLAAAAFSFVLNLLFWKIEKMGFFSEGMYMGDQIQTDSLFSSPLWQQLLLMGFASPLSEELLFRGVIFERLRLALPFFWAAILSAAFFGLVHGNWPQGIYAAIMGLLLAWLYEKKNRLWEPVLFHGTANLMALLMQIMLSKL